MLLKRKLLCACTNSPNNIQIWSFYDDLLMFCQAFGMNLTCSWCEMFVARRGCTLISYYASSRANAVSWGYTQVVTNAKLWHWISSMDAHTIVPGQCTYNCTRTTHTQLYWDTFNWHKTFISCIQFIIRLHQTFRQPNIHLYRLFNKHLVLEKYSFQSSGEWHRIFTSIN